MDRLAYWCIWLRRRSFFRMAQRTFSTLMPLAMIGAYFQVLQDSVFSPESFIYNLFDFDKLMSNTFWDIGMNLSQSVVQVIFSLFGIYVVYFAAAFTADLYEKDHTMAGISGSTILLVISYLTQVGKTGRVSLFQSPFLSIQYTLIALVVGYIVGQIFHWLAPAYEQVDYEHARMVQTRALNALKPSTVSILIGGAAGGLAYWLASQAGKTGSFTAFWSPIENSNNLLEIVPATILASFLNWIGIESPIADMSNLTTSAAATANLNFVLRRGSVWNVPYRFLGGSLIYSYGTMGGCVAVLAMLLAILIWGRRREAETVSKLNLIPVLFSSARGFMVGLPVVLNPIFCLQLTILPAFNVLVASLAIALKIVPTPVYAVLTGTPGPLTAFFATNGNWPTLIFSICLFIADILLMVPAVKLDNHAKRLLQQYERKEDQHV